MMSQEFVLGFANFSTFMDTRSRRQRAVRMLSRFFAAFVRTSSSPIICCGTALDLLPRLREIDSEIALLILTAHGSIDLAVRAIKEGAEQFLTKPLELPALLVILQRILENR